MMKWVREPRDPQPRRCLFLDRDGVLNEHIRDGYVLQWREFLWRPGAVSSLADAAGAGLPITVVSNQSCVGRGLASAETIRSIMDRMVDFLDGAGVRISAWYCCPHTPADGCCCRKPLAGMFYAAAVDMNLELNSSYLIGDSDTDTAAGAAAGCMTWQIGDPAELNTAIREVIARETSIVAPHEVIS